MSWGRTGTRVTARPVASRIAATMAGVDEMHGGSPTPFAARAVPADPFLHERRDDVGHVEERRQEIVREARVQDAPVVEHDLLHDREAQALRDAPFDLTEDRQRIQRRGRRLARSRLHDADQSQVEVDVYDGAVRHERERLVDRTLSLCSELVGATEAVLDLRPEHHPRGRVRDGQTQRTDGVDDVRAVEHELQGIDAVLTPDVLEELFADSPARGVTAPPKGSSGARPKWNPPSRSRCRSSRGPLRRHRGSSAAICCAIVTNPCPTSAVANFNHATPSPSRQRAVEWSSNPSEYPRFLIATPHPIPRRTPSRSAVRPAPPGRRIGSPSTPPTGASGNGSASVFRTQRATGATLSTTWPVMRTSPVCIALREAHRDRVEPAGRRQPIHLPFVREARLHDTEPAHRATGRDLSCAPPTPRRARSDTGTGPGPASWRSRAPRTTMARYRAPVEQHARLDVDDPPVVRRVVPHPDLRGMAVHVPEEALLTCPVLHLHRTAGTQRQETGVHLQTDVFTRAQRAAHTPEHEAHLVLGEVQARGNSDAGPRAATGPRRRSRLRRHPDRGRQGRLPDPGTPRSCIPSSYSPSTTTSPVTVGSPCSITMCRIDVAVGVDRLSDSVERMRGIDQWVERLVLHDDGFQRRRRAVSG